MTNNLARLLGPVAGGVLYAQAGFTATVTLDAGTFLIAGTLVLLVTPRPAPRVAPGEKAR